MIEQGAGFPAERRLRKSRDFDVVLRAGLRLHCQHFVLYAKQRPQAESRLGLTVSRKMGCAVVRNRIKRRLREIFRTRIAKSMTGYDIVVNTRKSISQCAYHELAGQFDEACKRILHMGIAAHKEKHAER